MYDEIIQAKSNSDATLRGCVFEQLIRESLPWDFRPPMSINAKREQLDAFFEWNSWHFHVETKAKVDPITGGSHDWEDFELKVLNRKGCVGLFCSLFPVSDSLYDAAEELARKGLTIIVIEGDMWEELQRLNFGFDAYLRYMVGYVRAHRSLKVRSIEKISDEIQNRSEIEAELSSRLTADSATFLRRYKQEFHDIVYVKREIEKKLLNSLRELTPSRLKENYRKHKRSDLELERVGAPQFLVIRDIAGAGKTTLSVEFASPNDKALTIARSAVEPDIDQMMAVMKAEGDDYGLKKLLLIDKPLLLIVDSLDEAEHIHQKLSEILSLIRLVENDSKSDREPTKIKDASDLNQIAKLEGLIQFPILIVFTVRDEYWERWATLFERRNIVTHKSVISEFQANELENAIQVYESAFSFKLRNGLTPQLRTTLAVPFNLRVFAEANQFRGSINVVDAYPENVLDLFFERKAIDAGKRGMQGYEQAEFMRITSAIAEAILLSENNGISRTSLIEVIEKCMPLLHGRGNQVLTALESDRILSKSPDGSEFGFRHARFMEYLVAWSAITKADDSSLSFLDRYVAAMISYPYLSPFRVRELILFLAKRLNEVTQRRIEEFFISSTNFAAANARRMRSEIRHGLTTSEDDIDLIKRTGVAGSPSVLWDNFFVLAAAANRQQSKVIAEAFKLAWDSNANSAERWKLIEKVNDRKMLSVDSIWSLISAHGNSREVETLLGRTLESGSYQLACEMAEIISKRFEPGPEWAVVVKLCAIAQSRGEYVLGNFV